MRSSSPRPDLGRHRKDRSGANMAEYGLLVALIALVAIGRCRGLSAARSRSLTIVVLTSPTVARLTFRQM